MAAKKRKPTRKQMREQRRAAIERKRQERGWVPVQSSFARSGDDGGNEISGDLLPLSPQSGDASAMSDPGIEQLMRALVASGDLVDEPEFESIFVSPLICVDAFIEVGQEMGVDPDSLVELPDKERDEIRLRMMEGTIQRLLTDELREEILKALNDLRRRLKRAGKPKEAAMATALHSFLSEMRASEDWAMIGVVRSVFSRSLEAGFQIFEAAEEDMEAEGAKEIRSSLLRRLTQSSPSTKADALIGESPGLTAYLERQNDQIWDEGMDAIHIGELYLELFSPEELERWLEVLVAVPGHDGKAAPPEEPHTGQLTNEAMEDLRLRLESYIAELFTPRRFEHLSTRLVGVLGESTVPKRWSSFVVLLLHYAREEDARDYMLQRVLPRALLGEMRALGEGLRKARAEGERKNHQE